MTQNTSTDPLTTAADLSTAPLWRRFAAMLYDGLILIAISMAYGGVVTGIGTAFESGAKADYTPMFQAGGLGELVAIGWVLTLAGFYVYFWRKSGQTVGMKAWRLRVVDTTNPNQTPSIVQCWQRAAWGLLSFALLGGGYWYRFFNTDGQCLHDKLTKTSVIVIPKSST